MPSSVVHLPNGQTFTVSPVFGGVTFKANDLATHRTLYPPGWTIILNEEDDDPQHGSPTSPENDSPDAEALQTRRSHIHRYKRPTLRNDHMYISAISNPNSADFKPASSPTRHIAMMLWASLWWYFHQPEPSMIISDATSAKTAEEGKPRGDWRININREGVLKGRNILSKLERMGLVTTEDSSVGTDVDSSRSGQGWTNMFVSRRAFWQIDARIFLFTLPPAISSPFPGGTPFSSRPSSPQRAEFDTSKRQSYREDTPARSLTPTPFYSSSHLPTYYPPHPPQYTFTNGIRHPIRPKPWRQGEVFYCRYVPAVGQYLSFRVASLSIRPPSRLGPWSSPAQIQSSPSNRNSLSDPLIPTIASLDLDLDNDVDLLHRWMNIPRVSHFWGEDGPRSHQEDFLRSNLSSKHSFPVIGCWNGKPFGYFEIYWVKEDRLGSYLGGEVGAYDRGIHCLVGEEEFRGPHRVKLWLSALVHHCWLDDLRTETVMLEPRVDNQKLANYLQEVGFYKEREVTFPHKQSNLFKIRRDAWECPCI